MNSVASQQCREPAVVMPTGQSYDAELTVDRWQGSERVQMRVTDVAVPDPGPRTIR